MEVYQLIKTHLFQLSYCKGSSSFSQSIKKGRYSGLLKN